MCIRDSDEYFSAPLNGFSSAKAFYDQASSIHFLEGITIPTLLLNAVNDPILSDQCYPTAIAKAHPYLYLEVTQKGGHVSFMENKGEFTWMDYRALEFLG